MSTRPILELSDATVVKGDRRVLDGLTLTIWEGQHTAIIGPNGAGKSILTRLLTSHERALASDNGTAPVRLFGDDNWDVTELRRGLGIISTELHQRFVSGNSEGRVTGEQAVLSAFFASHGILRYGVVTDEMRRRTASALERAGALHLARRTLDQMSSGEARRVLLARVLVTSPRALVLDEPTTGLDLAGRHDFMERVRAVIRDGTTLVLVTHHVDEIVPEIGRVVLLRDGRIAADGAKREVLTADRLTGLFGVRVSVNESGGYFSAAVAS